MRLSPHGPRRPSPQRFARTRLRELCPGHPTPRAHRHLTLQSSARSPRSPGGRSVREARARPRALRPGRRASRGRRRGSQERATLGSPPAFPARTAALRSRPQSPQHLPGRQLGMCRGPARCPDINNPGRGRQGEAGARRRGWHRGGALDQGGHDAGGAEGGWGRRGRSAGTGEEVPGAGSPQRGSEPCSRGETCPWRHGAEPPVTRCPGLSSPPS